MSASNPAKSPEFDPVRHNGRFMPQSLPDQSQNMSQSGIPSYTEAEHTTLVEFLESDRHQGLGYPETAGFLFALICAPRMVMPSDWISGVLGETVLADQEEANQILGALMSLNNWIAMQRESGEVPLPKGVELEPEAMDNFDASTPVSRWARGFLEGHGWVAEEWDLYVPDDAETGLALATLGFFSSRKFADAFCADAGEKPLPVEDFAETVCRLMPEAFTIYAAAGRKASDNVRQSGQEPARSEKFGRNEPCPCGSGKKYKKCCGRPH